MDPRSLRSARRAAVAERDAARQAAGRNAPRLARWRRFRRRVGGWLLELLAPTLVRLLGWTWRIERRGEAGLLLLASERPWIVAMWHGRMLTLMPVRLHCRRGIGVLVSPSDDGGLATTALRRFGYRVIRGSLSRGGSRALREMHDWVAGGGQLVVTPDGPRGPRHAINDGIAWLARATGAPILPVGVAVDRAWRLRSWDRFTIPKPFARLRIVYAEPVPVAATASDADLATISTRIRQRLLADEGDAFAALGVAADFAADFAAAGDLATDHPAAGDPTANDTA